MKENSIEEKILYKLFVRNRYLRAIVTKWICRREGGVFFSSSLRRFYKRYKDLEVGIGSYSWNNDNFDGPAIIGAYCGFGPGVRRFAVNHILTGVTTHPIWFNPMFGWVEKDPRERTVLTIGNDVWIGANTIILPSCKNIGNGAVIAAGSIVTKDIPQYEIWGGDPAKFIKKRFSDDIIEKIEASRWWEIDRSELSKFAKYFNDPEEFLTHLSNKK